MSIQELYKSALAAERETGIPALFVVAQAILESGWRITPISDSNNIYGIKYHIKKWGYVEALTTEFEDGVEYKKTLKFQKYPTLKDCIKDHTNLLTKYSYKKCLDKYKKDLKSYVQCVAKDYATDPYYAKKILNIIDSIKNTLEVVKVEIDKKQKEDENKYEREKEESKALMKKLGIINNFGLPWDDERAAVVITRVIKYLKS